LILGVFHEPTRLDAGLLVRKELQLWGSLCYTWDEYEYSLRLLAEGRIRPLVSHVLPLTEMESALALLRRREALKVVIRPVSEPS
jgi:threonine dehydrogenase-like Zn-dependent dehydrogenase